MKILSIYSSKLSLTTESEMIKSERIEYNNQLFQRYLFSDESIQWHIHNSIGLTNKLSQEITPENLEKKYQELISIPKIKTAKEVAKEVYEETVISWVDTKRMIEFAK